jgi:hypothetical protein
MPFIFLMHSSHWQIAFLLVHSHLSSLSIINNNLLTYTTLLTIYHVSAFKPKIVQKFNFPRINNWEREIIHEHNLIDSTQDLSKNFVNATDENKISTTWIAQLNSYRNQIDRSTDLLNQRSVKKLVPHFMKHGHIRMKNKKVTKPKTTEIHLLWESTIKLRYESFDGWKFKTKNNNMLSSLTWERQRRTISRPCVS